jgi:hypothetical protein
VRIQKQLALQVSNADSLFPSLCRAFLGCQVENAVDELSLSKKIISCNPSNLPLPDHVDCFVALNRSPSRLEFSEAPLGVHTTFDGSMILFENVVRVLHLSLLLVLFGQLLSRSYRIIRRGRDCMLDPRSMRSLFGTWTPIMGRDLADSETSSLVCTRKCSRNARILSRTARPAQARCQAWRAGLPRNDSLVFFVGFCPLLMP